LAWRTTSRLLGTASLVSALASVWVLVGSLIYITAQFGGPRWLPIAFLALWVAIPTGVLGVGICRSLRLHGRQHALRITAEHITYTSQGGIIPLRSTWTISRDALTSVRVLWGSGWLEFMTSTPGPLGTRVEGLKKCPAGRVPLAQVVGVEQWLQRELRGRWGKPVA
jgi:hypothetical protein